MNEQAITDILENTIGTLVENKSSLLSISDALKEEYEKKKVEIHKINQELPVIFQNTKKLRLLDRQLRNGLLKSSGNFTEQGYKNMEAMFNEVNQVHEAYLNAEQEEFNMVRRRDMLELELKQSISMMEKAENIVQQFMISISYLQNSLKKYSQNANNIQLIQEDESIRHYLELFTYVENEKLRIARDLHDGPAQQIVGTLMNVEICANAAQKDIQKGIVLLGKLKQDLANTLTDIRTIIFDLNPAPLEQLGFEKAIHNMLYSILNKDQISISFFYNMDETKVSKTLQNTIYRLIQELINNVKKHSKANRVLLRISIVNDYIYIHLMDNGVGFQVPEDLDSFRVNKKSYGISNIYTRIKELNGTLAINSDANNGTCFKIQLPMIRIEADS